MNQSGNKAQWILLLAVFVIATCGLIYELVAGTLASYLLGDSVTQFSTIIGVYLFSMGIGSFLSKYFQHHLLSWFIKIELLVGLIGGFSAALLFLVFPMAASFRIILYSLVSLTGILVGLEIPLLMRILKDKVEFSELVSRVFTFDYIGALLASLIFPLLLVPHLGLIRTSLFFGILNIAVGWYLAHRFRKELQRGTMLRAVAVLLLLAETLAFVFADRIMRYSESLQFNDNIVYTTSSPYQRVVITRNKRETRLFLNGNLQFSSADEYRYHEALVHPALAGIEFPKQVLVLGGGDGLAVREILRYPSVEEITLVDLDPAITKLFASQENLQKLNNDALNNKKVTVINQDAFTWLRDNSAQFDAIIIDFPDPSGFAIGKLYSTAFYRILRNHLRPGGAGVIQSTSPYVAPKSFWCIDTTLKAAGFYTQPYHNYVPSFGEWGYILISNQPLQKKTVTLPPGLRYLNNEVLDQLFIFPSDMQAHTALEVNRLNNQALVHYFEEEWNKYLEQ
ncbi:MAG: polyamine aminopropyltransferase [Terrimonas ferruginea]|jgi:spermidine synthase|uniref:polyamine aminopropyltransferase n=1 Tax=Terrimonas ferruginea TaxID=249 RepID=UPI0009275E55|nr:polyamine aminopropyltransferase [Terrimonas ferruginea]MBN8785174.1 polyamine aminopropyltransferase [Terrimonas ferruginea]OJW41271.1 MAG: spermidine synthase [Sphingobacteriales bacterium 48-107]